MTIPSYLFIFEYSIWRWSINDCLSPFRQFKSSTIIDQCTDYIQSNKSRNVNVAFKLRTDGTINVQMCHYFPFVLRRAAWIAKEYETRNANTSHIATLILVVIWEVFSDMRFVFYVLWKSEFVKNINQTRPELIEQMLARGFRAIYIAKHLCSVLVRDSLYVFKC